MYLVLGLGLSGLSTASFLKKKGEPFCVWDDLESHRDQAVKQEYPLFQEKDWPNITHIILSPGVAFGGDGPQAMLAHPMIQQARAHNLPTLTDCNLFIQHVKTVNPSAQFIGITGTNGKSTTTALLTHILKENSYDAVMGGNIGVPALSLGFNHQVYVLELSSFQLERSPAFELDFALWTNLSPDHLDKHGSMTYYQAAKERIFRNARHKIIMIDDALSKNVAEKYSDAMCFQTKNIIAKLPTQPFLKGTHNDQNRCLVYEALLTFGLSKEQILKGMETFKGLSHRQEYTGEVLWSNKRIVFINDSKSTSAEATKQALQTFSNNYLILGGQDKTDGADILLEYSHTIRRVYFFGQARERFSKTFVHTKIPKQSFEYLQDVVEAAFLDAKEDLNRDASMNHATLLFSPACASYDQYKNFEERGEDFLKIARCVLGNKHL